MTHAVLDDEELEIGAPAALSKLAKTIEKAFAAPVFDAKAAKKFDKFIKSFPPMQEAITFEEFLKLIEKNNK